MQEEKGTENKEVQSETKTEETKGLSLRDALEVANEAIKAPQTTEPEKTETVKEEVKAPVKEVPKFSAPGEWTPEERADFEATTPKQQEATLRLYNARKVKLEEIKREAADLEWAKELAKEVEPYLKAVGGKKKAHEALIDALKMRREFDEGDPREAAVAYLKAKGIPVPKELEEGIPESKVDNEKITTLQKSHDELKLRLDREDQAKFSQAIGQEWQTFERSKNAAGTPKFPDVNNTESGIRMSSNIGSLVNGVTDLSKQFIASVKSRIPDVTMQVLLSEAYKYFGGKVDDSEAPKTQSTQKHIAKSSRAASSVPGRGAHSTSSGPVKLYKTRREASEAALAEIREREGA